MLLKWWFVIGRLRQLCLIWMQIAASFTYQLKVLVPAKKIEKNVPVQFLKSLSVPVLAQKKYRSTVQ